MSTTSGPIVPAITGNSSGDDPSENVSVADLVGLGAVMMSSSGQVGRMKQASGGIGSRRLPHDVDDMLQRVVLVPVAPGQKIPQCVVRQVEEPVERLDL